MFDVAPSALLPDEIGDGRRFATGDAMGLTDAESLNLAHPLVRAAIARARTWSGGGSVNLHVPPGSSQDIAALVGKTGVVSVVLVDYLGFEPVQRLVAEAVVGGSPIDPTLAAKVARLKATDRTAFEVEAQAQWLDDAVDEAVFVDQRQVEEGEQKHAWCTLRRWADSRVVYERHYDHQQTGGPLTGDDLHLSPSPAIPADHRPRAPNRDASKKKEELICAQCEQKDSGLWARLLELPATHSVLRQPSLGFLQDPIHQFPPYPKFRGDFLRRVRTPTADPVAQPHDLLFYRP